MNKAGFNYITTEDKFFKLPTSSDSLEKTTLEGLRYLFNENFKVSEIELNSLKDLISKISQINKVKYRNASALNKNYISNSDFTLWDNGVSFNFDSFNTIINTSNSWLVNTRNSTGSIFRQSFVPQNQIDVPEYPDYYLGINVSNFSDKVYLSQIINDASIFNGKNLVLSSYLRSTENGISIKPIIRIKYGTSSTYNDTIIEGTSASINKIFSRYSSIFTMPIDITSKSSSGSYIEIIYEIQEAGPCEVHFSSIQLEDGLLASQYKSNLEIENQSLYLIDTTLGAFELKLPSNPFQGMIFSIFDIAGKLNLNNLTLNPNGFNITNSSSNLILSDKNVYMSFRYINNSLGWIVTNYKDGVNIDSGFSRIQQVQSLTNSFICG